MARPPASPDHPGPAVRAASSVPAGRRPAQAASASASAASVARERGATTVADRVLVKIARQAAAEAATPVGGRVLRTAASRSGRVVRASVDLALPLSEPTPHGLRHLQEHVAARTRRLTGLAPTTPRIRVRRLTAGRTGTAAASCGGPVDTRARRTWSQRRPATACLAVALVLLACLVLWKAVHPHPLPAAPALGWRPGPQALRLGAGLVGVSLVCAALTPGRRRLVDLRGTPDVRAQITRAGAARMVRAALAGLPGLRVRTVRFTRCRVTVRADLAFGSPADVEAAARAVVADTVEGMAPARSPRVRLVLADTRVRFADSSSEEAADA